MSEFFPSWRSSDYYFAADDIRKYPDAWCIVVWSRRGPGKTYSMLRWTYENNIPIVYMKRTNKDIDMLCNNTMGVDMSPYVPICRDTGYQIKPGKIADGIGGFYNSVDDKPEGAPFAYCVSLNAIREIKGIDLSFADYIVLDEFIPQPGEVVKHSEGEQLLSVYMTVSRDRVKRGRDNLKLILFANADAVSTPITQELDIVDDMVDLSASGESHYYIEDRGILLHHITDKEIPLKAQEKSGIYKAMINTAWGRKSFGGDFASNDFSNVKKIHMKGYRPICSYYYKSRYTYVYRNSNGEYYLTYSKGRTTAVYNLDHESEQKKFFYDWVGLIRDAMIEGRVKCETYSMYDLITCYKKIFVI